MPDAGGPKTRRTGAELFRRVFDLGAGSGKPKDGRGERPVIGLCNLILSEALLNKATQIRLAEPKPDYGSVEYLIAGQWQPVMKIPVQGHRQVVNRLKFMACLDISRVPEQKGTLHLEFKGEAHILAITVQALPSGSDIAVLELAAAAT